MGTMAWLERKFIFFSIYMYIYIYISKKDIFILAVAMLKVCVSLSFSFQALVLPRISPGKRDATPKQGIYQNRGKE